MATTIPYKDKDGNIISYQIQVFRGRDSSGKKLKPFTTSWKVPETYKSEKAIQKALEKAVGEFESECRKGKIPLIDKTLSEYCRYYISLKKGNKKKSTAFYNSLLPRIDERIGYIKLPKLTANHLNEFYMSLEEDAGRKDTRAVAKKVLASIVAQRRLLIKSLSIASGLSVATVSNAIKQKHINVASAEKIASALDMKTSALFDVIILGDSKGLSAKSISHYHTFIHSVLQTAYREDAVVKNVADCATPPAVPVKEAEFFEIEEILQIHAALNKYPMKYRVMICLLIDTGIRRGELFGLRWESIAFDKLEITVEENIQWVKGEGLYADTPKGKKTRTISISKEMADLLKTYRSHQNKYKLMRGIPDFNPKGYLFIQNNGSVMHPNSLNHWVKKFEVKENLPHIYPHKFRHSQASILFYSGVDPVTVSGRLGHAQASTSTNLYGHMLNKADRKASDAIANALYRTNNA